MAVERTLVFVKPDGVQRRLVGKILSRFEERGLKLVGLKLMRVSEDLARTHYAEHQGKGFYERLVKFVTSGPIAAAVIEGNSAIKVVRDMMGKTFCYDAAPGTIRGDLGISNQYNLIHGSDGPDAARREIELYFKPDELLTYTVTDDVWMAAE